MSKLTTKVTCPKCGAEFKIAEKTSVAVGIVIGKDSNLGEIHPELEGSSKGKPSKASERIEALKAAGVDVSNLFAMQGANGEDFAASYSGVELNILNDDDPIFNAIKGNGDIPNRKLFRRWVMAQMFRMLYAEVHPESGRPSYSDQLRRLGYDYQWKMLENELHAQWKMFQHNDLKSYKERNLWFHRTLVVEMTNEYVTMLSKYIEELPVKHCKGIPYKRINKENVFVSDIYNKILKNILRAMHRVQEAQTPYELYASVVMFNRYRIKLGPNTPQHKNWVNAYKGAGSYYTLQNMIRFHGCILRGKNGRMLSKEKSLEYLDVYANETTYGNEYMMLGMLRQALKDNHIDIAAKFKEWKNKRNK